MMGFLSVAGHPKVPSSVARRARRDEAIELGAGE